MDFFGPFLSSWVFEHPSEKPRKPVDRADQQYSGGDDESIDPGACYTTLLATTWARAHHHCVEPAASYPPATEAGELSCEAARSVPHRLIIPRRRSGSMAGLTIGVPQSLDFQSYRRCHIPHVGDIDFT